MNSGETANPVIEQVKRILIQVDEESPKSVADIKNNDVVFGPSGVLADSLLILDALCEIENNFGIEIPDEDLTEELFASVNNLANYVSRQMESA